MRLTPSIAALGCLLLPVVSPAMERAELMPADPVFRLHITGAGELWNNFDEAFGKNLRNDERFNRFSTALMQKVKRKTKSGTFSPDVFELFEILKCLEGEILIVEAGVEGRKKNMSCMAATADPEACKTILERTAWLHKTLEGGFDRQTADFNGTTLVHDIIQGGTTNECHLWISSIRNTLLVSNERSWVEQNLVRLDQESLKEPTGKSALNLTIPVEKMLLNSLKDKTPEQKQASLNSMRAFGFLDITEYSMALSFEEDAMIFDGVLSGAFMGKGLFNLLSTEPENYDDRRIIPTDATSFSLGKIDLMQFWKELPSFLGSLSPKTAAGIAGSIGFFQQQSGLDIQHDILAHMGTQFSLSSATVSTNKPAILVWELNDGKALNESFARLLASPIATKWSSFITASDYRGQTLYTPKGDEDDGSGPTLSITRDWLILGMHGDLTRDLIQRLDNDVIPKPLPMESKARHYAPENAFGFGGMNHRKAACMCYVKVSDSSFSAGLGVQSGKKKKGEKEEETLEENEISLDYLTTFIGNTYHFAEAVPNGIHHRILFEIVK